MPQPTTLPDDPLSSSTTRYIPRSKPAPNYKHPRKPLAWSRSKLYTAENRFGHYEDLWLDRSHNFAKLRTDAARMRYINLDPKTGQPHTERRARFKPAYLSYLKAMDKYRLPTLYRCDYCEDRKRLGAEGERRERAKAEVREGLEEVFWGWDYDDVDDGDDYKVVIREREEEEEEERARKVREQEDRWEEGEVPGGFGLGDLPQRGEVVMKAGRKKKKNGRGDRLREVKSLDELSSSACSWSFVGDGDLESVDGSRLGRCLHRLVVEDGETSSDDDLLTRTTGSDIGHWEVLDRD
ncbi:hypothetical protein QBC44DRAFT_386208 [Cladorrhinum sp. PSN332]|nr:hypothetical protein QBC44DRAFT_386208 [Cladorrhinum sp. PSN332]